ncbi:MAG: T9SS type A sorting domain-containing protein [Candidatus Marinimicrobia bacterium]|nr:T9SS type A sorting domain-containing protein [Candidatus Neomarinimicrobiota bacterium]MCF7840381.1 T9SS type A sorting domain-containing protein [Candidatus Neomarinimicrobiota bacterium]MCF7901972.1 T9SS type A sorting domain-containing protein [Candidatus Neomarinimicrobiota bacterium]
MIKSFLQRSFFSLFFGLTVLNAATIWLDGRLNDWENIPVAESDHTGDGLPGVDFLSVSQTCDSTRLYFKLVFTDSLLLQDYNDVALYLDTDTNATTGLVIGDLGAELVWHFGTRSGQQYITDPSEDIIQSDIGMITPPTITSDHFEIALNRSTLFGGEPLFPQQVFRYRFVDERTNGDAIPNPSAGLPGSFANDTAAVWNPISLDHFSEETMRLMTQNTLYDGIFDSLRGPAHARILQALEPEIIAFQEVYGYSSEQIRLKVTDILGGSWYASAIDGDVATISRYPILGSWEIWSSGRITADLIDTGFDMWLPILVINSHWSCCANDAARQNQVDATIAWLRETVEAGSIPEMTSIIVTGDLNLVGDAQQLTTLLTGDIQDEATFGADFSPDWGRDLIDLYSTHTNDRVTYTWRSDHESFSPGKLDYIVYSNSLIVWKHFILDTQTMTAEDLTANNLQSDDSWLASDHLAHVADISPDYGIGVQDELGPKEYDLIQTYPNPFNPTLSIRVNLPMSQTGQVVIFDVSGRQITQLTVSGKQTLTWDASEFSSGIYLIRLMVGNHVLGFEKVVLVK